MSGTRFGCGREVDLAWGTSSVELATLDLR